jgi:hypothetical protein
MVEKGRPVYLDQMIQTAAAIERKIAGVSG